MGFGVVSGDLGGQKAFAQIANYSQHRQNYSNNYFRAEVGKKLPKQFPEPFLVAKQGVGNLELSCAARHERPETI